MRLLMDTGGRQTDSRYCAAGESLVDCTCFLDCLFVTHSPMQLPQTQTQLCFIPVINGYFSVIEGLSSLHTLQRVRFFTRAFISDDFSI